VLFHFKFENAKIEIIYYIRVNLLFMNQKQKSEAFTIYLILASMFIAALVASNLIF